VSAELLPHKTMSGDDGNLKGGLLLSLSMLILCVLIGTISPSTIAGRKRFRDATREKHLAMPTWTPAPTTTPTLVFDKALAALLQNRVQLVQCVVPFRLPRPHSRRHVAS
jgi:hypothetical protein